MARPPTESTQIEEAIVAVQSGSMSLREAARKYDVSRTTLQRRVRHRVKCRASEASGCSALEPVVVKQEDFSHAVTDTHAQSGTNNEDITESKEVGRQQRNKICHKRLASHLQTHGQGPQKVINCKIRMLCTAAGSALDELSNEMIREGNSIYKLGLGQSPFPIPQCIIDELRANSHQRDYLPVAGSPELCADIAAWGTDRLHINYLRDDVLVGPGTKELLFVLQTVYYGDLLLPNPSCTSYAPQAAIAGRNMMWLPTHAEDHFVLRPEVLEAHCAKDPDAPRILILNSPSNPTGCAYQADELEALAKVARKYRVLVVSDEIYSELHHSGTHFSLSKYYPEGTIVSGGLSKWCGAGGWRMGFWLANGLLAEWFWLFPPSMDWLRSSMLVMASETYTSVASPIQYAARRAFVLGCVELASYKRKCQKTLQLVGRWFAYQLQKMDVEVQVPEAGFYLFPCFRRHRKALALRGIGTDEQLWAQLLQETGVAILPGSAFGRAPEELFARLAVVDFKGDLALYLIESMQDNPSLEAIEGFIQSVCPNLDIAMRKLAAWIALSPAFCYVSKRQWLVCLFRLKYLATMGCMPVIKNPAQQQPHGLQARPMVVLRHNDLDRTLWGPASTSGRSRATDIAIYIQLAVVGLLGVVCSLDYEKPESLRLAAAWATQLMYFRSTALFVRVMLFISATVLYGDVIIPINRLARSGEAVLLPTAKLVLHCIWMLNTLRILYAIFQSGALTSAGRKKLSVSSAYKCARKLRKTR
ncbi:unnamed protein product [Peronospora destructor]|uniref:HTH psq-type domain-containing protein n=1 Tax=Peronospora destructor TaxID=86335 RepID=A0AAV0U1J3_9STRA|nr:unnamed protein product [Peronospora destructor]